MRLVIIKIVFLAVLLSVNATSAEFTVTQKNKAFSTKTISIHKGDTVHFLNEDPFFHNVFSLSDIQFFDLGSYPKGESKAVLFETVGKVEVECAIHSEMFLTIEVKE